MDAEEMLPLPGVAHQPAPVDAAVDAVVDVVFDAAKSGKLVICAGAGLSRATPSSLPGGQELGRLLDEQLSGLIDGYVSPNDPSNLVAVADAGARVEAGETALRSEVLRLAQFDEADPNHGHRAIAELLCEGGVQLLLLWNWDDCIERVDVSPERLQVARSNQDLADLMQPSIAKVHGCATRRSTLLITTEDLDSPPFWTDETFRKRLTAQTIVFVGVGDVADYAHRRLSEMRETLANESEAPLDVYVVAPQIREEWGDSDWATLIPDMPEQRRIAQSADEFLDQLARRWARDSFDELQQSTGSALDMRTSEALKVVRRELGSLGAVGYLRWCRRSAIGQAVGVSVAFCQSIKQLLVAISVLVANSSGETFKARGPAAFELEGDRIEVLVASNPEPADRIRQRARHRAAALANDGLVDAHAAFLVSGIVWGGLEDDPDLELDVAVGTAEVDDLVAGSDGVGLSFVMADDLVSQA